MTSAMVTAPAVMPAAPAAPWVSVIATAVGAVPAVVVAAKLVTSPLEEAVNTTVPEAFVPVAQPDSEPANVPVAPPPVVVPFANDANAAPTWVGVLAPVDVYFKPPMVTD